MRRLFSLFLLLYLPSYAYAASTYDHVIESGTIRCGYFTWPPYLMKDPNSGAITGLNYDYMMEIGKVLGLKIEWVEETTSATATAGLDAGRYDALCSSVWPDEARLKFALLTDPTFYTSVYAIVRKDDDRFDSGKIPLNSPEVTFATLDGDVTYFTARDEFPKSKTYTLPQSADGSQLLQSVVSKKADVTLVDKGLMGDFNRTNGNPLKAVAGLPPVRIFPEVLVVKRGDIEMKLVLDNAIRIINDRGEPAEWIKKYPGYEFFAPVPGWQNVPAKAGK